MKSMKAMTMLTVKGSLIRFKRYYLLFTELNNKENRDYMHYPFSDIRKGELIDEWKIVDGIQQSLNMYDPAVLSFIMHNIILGEQNNTNHKVATFIFYKTLHSKIRQKGTKDNPSGIIDLPYNSTYFLSAINNKINSRLIYFIKELETIETLDWMPNG